MLVTIDTLRADRVGAYGDEEARTPVLDRLARDGVRFANAISPVPLTLPTHTTLMTGVDPPRHGVRHNSGFELPESLPMLAERMAEAGYDTAAFVGAFVLAGRTGIGRGFATFDDDVGRRQASTMFSPTERQANHVVDSALAWLESAPPQFFLWVHFYDPHASYDPPPAFELLFPTDPYAGEIAFSDSQLGRLIAAVDAKGEAEDTLIVVTSDHGEALGEHDETTHSYGVYDTTQRVPLLIRGPDVPAGRVVEDVVALADVAPTILDLVGAPPLAEAEGRSLAGLWSGADDESRPAYVETLATQLDMGWSPLFGVRSRRYKYIRATDPELYDVSRDPAETMNLVETHPEIARDLDAELARRLTAGHAPDFSPELDPDARQQLESLGYVVPQQLDIGVALGEVGGPNPRDHLAESVLLNRAAFLANDGRAAEGLALIRDLEGTGLRIERYRAFIALLASDIEVAKKASRQLVALGYTRQGRTFLGRAFVLERRLDEARRQLELALEEEPHDDPAPLIGLAVVDRLEDDLASSRTRLEQALEIRPTHIEGRWRLAEVLIRQGTEGALRRADELLASLDADERGAPRVSTALANAEVATGRIERAIDRLAEARVHHPKSWVLWRKRGTLLLSRGRHAEAIRDLEEALALHPDDPLVKNDIAWSRAETGDDLDRALELALDAAGGADPSMLDTLASVHLRRGEPRQALEVADRALGTGPSPSEGHLQYVRAASLAALGRSNEARSALEAARRAAGDPQPDWLSKVDALENELDAGA